MNLVVLDNNDGTHCVQRCSDVVEEFLLWLWRNEYDRIGEVSLECNECVFAL